MRLPVGAEDYAGHVAPRLLAAPAELVMAALPEMLPGTRMLEIAWTTGVLTQALARAHNGRLRVTSIEEHPIDPPVSLPPSFIRLNSRPGALPPFEDASFDVVVGNLALLGRHEDEALLKSVARVLIPGGTLCASVLLEGSFDELFDILTEVSEQESLPRVRAALTDARRALTSRAALEGSLARAGFELEAYGEEERALWFGSGQQTVDDPLVWRGLLGAWLEGTAPLPDPVRAVVARFIDTYFHGARFPVVVRTGVVRARSRAEHDG